MNNINHRKILKENHIDWSDLSCWIIEKSNFSVIKNMRWWPSGAQSQDVSGACPVQIQSRII